MKKVHNFNAGPSILPRVAIENTANAILDLNGIGMSILEISHRSKDFQAIIDEAVALFKEQLGIPEGYHVLFLGGGASMQFCMVPYNLMEKKAAYLETGVWAKKAIKEAKLFGEVLKSLPQKKVNSLIFQRTLLSHRMRTTFTLLQITQFLELNGNPILTLAPFRSLPICLPIFSE